MIFRFCALLLFVVFIAGCANDSVIQEHIIVTPHLVVFAHGEDSTATVSITHSCTCPFTWYDSISPRVNWLTFSPGMSGDHTDLQVAIHRSLLVTDTSRTTIFISSNGYGSDTIGLVAVR